MCHGLGWFTLWYLKSPSYYKIRTLLEYCKDHCRLSPYTIPDGCWLPNTIVNTNEENKANLNITYDTFTRTDIIIVVDIISYLIKSRTCLVKHFEKKICLRYCLILINKLSWSSWYFEMTRYEPDCSIIKNW